MFKLDVREWEGASVLGAVDLECGYCGKSVSSNTGYTHKLDKDKAIVLCPGCGGPTFYMSLHTGRRMPEAMPGRSIAGAPKDVTAEYNEARRAVAGTCYTAATLLCRSILMHVASDKGLAGTPTLKKCVQHLIKEGHVAKKDQDRLDGLRTFASANIGEVRTVSRTEALKVLGFTEHLLLEVYE